MFKKCGRERRLTSEREPLCRPQSPASGRLSRTCRWQAARVAADPAVATTPLVARHDRDRNRGRSRMKAKARTEAEVTDADEMYVLVGETNLKLVSWTRRAHGH